MVLINFVSVTILQFGKLSKLSLVICDKLQAIL